MGHAITNQDFIGIVNRMKTPPGVLMRAKSVQTNVLEAPDPLRCRINSQLPDGKE
jgi:hypothetical protein